MTSQTERVVRVLVVEDHERMRAAMVAAIDAVTTMAVVAETPSARDAVSLAQLHRPDVAVLDVRLPDGNGVDVCSKLRATCPEVRCVIVTSHEDAGIRDRVAEAGAVAFVLKTTRVQDLTVAVRQAYEGLEFAAG